MRKKIDTFEIMNKSKHTFEGIFNTWICVEQIPDMEHIDYRLVVRENMEPTGKMFAVQLKGQEKVEIKNGILKFRDFKVKHLKYYIDKVIDPVFLFVVDNSKSICYYLFLQKWLKEGIQRKKWRQQQTTTIEIPITNILLNETDFIPIVTSAIEYMRELKPSKLRSAFKNEINKIKELDPRFNVDTYISKNKLQFYLIPNSKVSIKASILDQHSIEKYVDFQKSGNKVKFDTNKIDFPDLPIYQYLKQSSNKFKVVIMKRPKKSELQLLYNYSNKSYVTIILGSISTGSEQSVFSSEFYENLLKIEFYLNTNGPNLQISDYKFKFDFISYLNKTILNLPYFDDLYALINCLNNNIPIKTRFMVNGLEIFTGNFSNNEIKLEVQSTLKLLFKSIEISKFFKVNPVLRSFDELFKHQKVINMYYELLTIGYHEMIRDFDNIDLTLRLNSNAQKGDLLKTGKSYDFMLVSENTEEIFMGYKVMFGKLAYSYSNWELINDVSNMKLSEPVKLKLKANSRSKIIVTKLK